MREKRKKRILTAAFAALCLSVFALGAADWAIQNTVSAHSYEEASEQVAASLYYEGEVECAAAFGSVSGGIEKQTATANIFGIPLKKVEVSVYKDVMLIPGGETFGVRLNSDRATVVGIGEYESGDGGASPAKAAGIRVNDQIVSVDGTKITGAESLTRLIEQSEGRELTIGYIRNGVENTTVLTPVKGSDGKYKAGLWVRDSTAGIGTVTYYNPADGTFGGLGHGVCNSDSGELIPFTDGEVYNAVISGTVKGIPGDPGELRGYFSGSAVGYISSNTEMGVFGKINTVPTEKKAIPIGLKNEVHTGKVTIYCTIEGNKVQAWDAEIIKIVSTETKTKNFIIEITDQTLLSVTGGVLQGMSGSTISQNGKIIGAVTHVMINDPTRGYEIFIENMLSAQENGG